MSALVCGSALATWKPTPWFAASAIPHFHTSSRCCLVSFVYKIEGGISYEFYFYGLLKKNVKIFDIS
jgi:hypothetical protein